MALFASNVALATIVCTYVLSFITVICIAIYVFVRVHLIGIYRLSLENISTSLAILITMGLVAQITWAVTDEGQGEHVAEVTRSQFELTAKVCHKAVMNTIVVENLLTKWYGWSSPC